MKALYIFIAFTLLFTACSSPAVSPAVINTHQVGDNSLTCEQIKKEIFEAERFEKEARGSRSTTGNKNIAAAVLFLPALVGTYANSEEAIEAAKERREYLFDLAASKNCGF